MSDIGDQRATVQEDAVPDASAPISTTAKLAALVPTMALAACGGGGDGAAATTPSGASPPVAVVQTITPTQASRFLAQATMGATRATIDTVVARGFEKWLDDQFALPRAISHWEWLNANGYADAQYMFRTLGFEPTVWRQLIVEPDQLRQRVAMALLDIMVVGIGSVNVSWRQYATAAYVDLLLDNAFGNYRTLLEAITYNAAMGSFLTFVGNRKANPKTGSQPDENYARELMQLFTIGVQQLNMDGTVKTANGAALETYGQSDVSQLARVFTGLTFATTDKTVPDRYRQPLVMNAAYNETGASSFLGGSVSGGGTAAIKSALDIIFAHPNLPPFVSKQLIQRLVTSNPTPAYVGRVAAIFADNGSGVRGDMKAVIRAILLDSEARSDAALTSTTAGKLREPVMRLTGWARAFGVTSPSGAWAFDDASSPTYRLGQSKGRAPSVFNFYRPGYTPPNTAMAKAGLVSPEFQIVNEQTVVAYINYMQSLIANGSGDARADYTAMLALADNATTLVDEVNLILAAGQLGPATLAAIRTAVDSVSPTASNGPLSRVGIAILLTLAAPDFLTLK